MNRTLEEYLALPYTVEILPDQAEETPVWVARVVELPGCLTQADSFTELEGMIEDAKRLWLQTALEDGIPIPEPRQTETYSGKFVLRLPKSLHRQLVTQAEMEGVSLNQYINVILAKSVQPGNIRYASELQEIQPPLIAALVEGYASLENQDAALLQLAEAGEAYSTQRRPGRSIVKEIHIARKKTLLEPAAAEIILKITLEG